MSWVYAKTSRGINRLCLKHYLWSKVSVSIVTFIDNFVDIKFGTKSAVIVVWC